MSLKKGSINPNNSADFLVLFINDSNDLERSFCNCSAVLSLIRFNGFCIKRHYTFIRIDFLVLTTGNQKGEFLTTD